MYTQTHTVSVEETNCLPLGIDIETNSEKTHQRQFTRNEKINKTKTNGKLPNETC